MSITFDSLGYALKLENAGVPREQAQVQAEAFREQAELSAQALKDQARANSEALEKAIRQYDESSRKDLATKQDIQDVRGEIQDVRAEIQDLRLEMRDMDSHIRNWVIGSMLALAAIIVGAMGLMISAISK